MNKFLSNVMNGINYALFLLLIVGGTVLGVQYLGDIDLLPVAIIAASFSALVTCGVIALQISIKDELVTANEHLKKLSKKE